MIAGTTLLSMPISERLPIVANDRMPRTRKVGDYYTSVCGAQTGASAVRRLLFFFLPPKNGRIHLVFFDNELYTSVKYRSNDDLRANGNNQ